MSSALIYIRQSRHKADQRTVSPEVQEQACRAMPATKACTEILVYRDLDVSGGKLKGRTAYAAMVKRIEAGPVAVVTAPTW